jgi:hypothetical protein
MRPLLLAALAVLTGACSCHDAGSAFKVSAASTLPDRQLWRRVDAVVRAFARERKFPLLQTSGAQSKGNRCDVFSVDPPDPTGTTSLSVFYDPDTVHIEVSEVGVCRPSRKHISIRQALETRLETAGFRVSKTTPRIIITF